MKKVVLLGDSIRMIGYGTKIKDYLPDVDLWQPEDNCRFAKYTLRMLFDYKEQIENADVIHFNVGVWDTCTLYGDNIPFTNIKEYVKTTCRIADILKRYGKTVIFSTTTPIRIGQPHNTNERIDKYNKAVCKALKKKGVIINDINAIIKQDINKYIREDDCIHLTDEAIDLLAKEIADKIKENF